MVPYLNGKKRNPSQNQTHLFKQLSDVRNHIKQHYNNNGTKSLSIMYKIIHKPI